MSKLNGTKLLNVSLDMETYGKLKLMKGDKTWLEFLQFMSNTELVNE